MSLLPFLVVSVGAAIAGLILRREPQLMTAIGVGGLLLATIAALLITPGDVLKLGSGEVLVATGYGRLFVLLGSASGLVLCLVALSTTWQVNLPSALLLGLAGIAIGLALPDPLTAMLVLLGTASAVSLVCLDVAATAADVRAVVRQVRLVVLAGLLAFAAVAWAGPALSGIGSDPAAFGLADLAIVLAVAIRFGAIPFHRPVGQLTNTAPGLAVPLLLVWGPAALAVVALGATDGSVLTLLVPDGFGQALIVLIAAASLFLGAVGAWLQDDLEHVVGYSIVQDAGFVLLGLAVGGPLAHQPARLWLLILIAAKTAFAAWATVVQDRFRTARLPELHGWARRSPLLAVGLAGIALATIGVPGLLAWSVRTSLVQGATSGPLQVVLVIGGLASLAYYGRVGLIGAGRENLLVAAAAPDRPVAVTRADSAIGTLRAGWRTNRAPIAAGLVLVLVVVSVLVSAGGLGGPAAAQAAAPQPSPAALSQ